MCSTPQKQPAAKTASLDVSVVLITALMDMLWWCSVKDVCGRGVMNAKESEESVAGGGGRLCLFIETAARY